MAPIRKGGIRVMQLQEVERGAAEHLFAEVPWDAANQASVDLAKSLGYRDVTEYTVLEFLP